MCIIQCFPSLFILVLSQTVLLSSFSSFSVQIALDIWSCHVAIHVSTWVHEISVILTIFVDCSLYAFYWSFPKCSVDYAQYEAKGTHVNGVTFVLNFACVAVVIRKVLDTATSIIIYDSNWTSWIFSHVLVATHPHQQSFLLFNAVLFLV